MKLAEAFPARLIPMYDLEVEILYLACLATKERKTVCSRIYLVM